MTIERNRRDSMEATEYKEMAEAICEAFFSEFKKFLLDMHEMSEQKSAAEKDKLCAMLNALKEKLQ